MSGACPAPSEEEFAAGMAACPRRPKSISNHTATLLFSRAAGVEPEFHRWPELARAFLFGPLTPVSFRMSGHDSLADAPRRFAQEVQAFGCMPSNELTSAELTQLQTLANARGETSFRHFVASLCSHAHSA